MQTNGFCRAASSIFGQVASETTAAAAAAASSSSSSSSSSSFCNKHIFSGDHFSLGWMIPRFPKEEPLRIAGVRYLQGGCPFCHWKEANLKQRHTNALEYVLQARQLNQSDIT